MSAGVQDQRKNPQLQGNGSKESGGGVAVPELQAADEQADVWRSQQHGYSTAGMPASADPYLNSYYGAGYPPYQAFGVGDGAWSSGGDHLAFMGGYSQAPVQPDSYGADAMFGQGFGGFGQPGFGGYGAFHGSGDYAAGWGAGAGLRKYDDYYRGDPATYGGDERAVKHVEQGMQGLSMDAKQDEQAAGSGEQQPPGAPQKKSWASIASQPARPNSLQQQPPPRGGKPPAPAGNGTGGVPPGGPSGPAGVPGRGDVIGVWEGRAGPVPAAAPPARPPWTAPRARPPPQVPPPPPAHPVLDELRDRNEYNPREFDLGAKDARFFVIKSYSEDDIHRSIKYEIWASTEHGNKRLDSAFREREGKGPIYLLYSVNGSGHFCGMAQMLSPVDYSSSASVWAQDKWKGQFKVKWIYVKDVPNSQLRHIRLENNENKPVTNSRDTQEVPADKGRQVLKIMHAFSHRTSIFDDFVHYEQRQEEEEGRKPAPRDHGKPNEEPSGARAECRGDRGRGKGRRN